MSAAAGLCLAVSLILLGRIGQVTGDREPVAVLALHGLGVVVIIGAAVWLWRRLDRHPVDVVPPALLTCCVVGLVLFVSTAAEWISSIGYAGMCAGLAMMTFRTGRPCRAPDSGSPGGE